MLVWFILLDMHTISAGTLWDIYLSCDNVSFISPEISQISPGIRLIALILWTPLPLFLITFAISGSYSFRASIALSAFLSYNIKCQIIKPLKQMEIDQNIRCSFWKYIFIQNSFLSILAIQYANDAFCAHNHIFLFSVVMSQFPHRNP